MMTREERLEKALQQISDPEWGSIYPEHVFAETKRIARKALSPIKEKESCEPSSSQRLHSSSPEPQAP